MRCHMHFVTGRAEERLTFDLQRAIAERIGYAAARRPVRRRALHEGLFPASPRMSATSRPSSAPSWRRARPSAARCSTACSAASAASAAARSMGDDFIVDNNRINVADDDAFERDPVNLIRLFWLADRHNLRDPSRRDAARHALAQAHRPDPAQRPGGQPAVPRHPDLAQRAGGGAAADERGRRARPLHPGFRPHRRDDAVQHVPPLHGGRAPAPLDRRAGRDRGGPARETSIRSRNKIVAHDPQPARALRRACSCTTSPRAGRRIIRSPAPRSPASSGRASASTEAETETVAWLVEHHLLMSNTAQSRDLSDPATIKSFAEVVQTMERLKLLLVLTIADIKAVGPGVWTGWKGQLLRTLYYETEVVLGGGAVRHRPLGAGAARAGASCARELPDWTDAEFDAYAARHYPAYWLKIDETAPGEAGALRPRGREGPGARSRPTYETDAVPRRHRAHRPVARPSAPARHHHRRLRGGGRQHRRRADLHDHRRHGARHHRPVRAPSTGTRTSCAGPSGSPTAIERALKGEVKIADLVDGKRPAQGALEGLPRAAGGRHRQLAVEPPDRDRGVRARPAGPALRPHDGARQAQPQHRLGPYRRPSARRRWTCST